MYNPEIVNKLIEAWQTLGVTDPGSLDQRILKQLLLHKTDGLRADSISESLRNEFQRKIQEAYQFAKSALEKDVNTLNYAEAIAQFKELVQAAEELKQSKTPISPEAIMIRKQALTAARHARSARRALPGSNNGAGSTSQSQASNANSTGAGPTGTGINNAGAGTTGTKGAGTGPTVPPPPPLQAGSRYNTSAPNTQSPIAANWRQAAMAFVRTRRGAASVAGFIGGFGLANHFGFDLTSSALSGLAGAGIGMVVVNRLSGSRPAGQGNLFNGPTNPQALAVGGIVLATYGVGWLIGEHTVSKYNPATDPIYKYSLDAIGGLGGMFIADMLLRYRNNSHLAVAHGYQLTTTAARKIIKYGFIGAVAALVVGVGVPDLDKHGDMDWARETPFGASVIDGIDTFNDWAGKQLGQLSDHPVAVVPITPSAPEAPHKHQRQAERQAAPVEHPGAIITPDQMADMDARIRTIKGRPSTAPQVGEMWTLAWSTPVRDGTGNDPVAFFMLKAMDVVTIERVEGDNLTISFHDKTGATKTGIIPEFYLNRPYQPNQHSYLSPAVPTTHYASVQSATPNTPAG